MRLIILGSTGMLGRALLKEANNRSIEAVGIARTGADFNLNIQDKDLLKIAIRKFNPDIIINTVALTNLAVCELCPQDAYLTNAQPVAELVEICRNNNIYLIQISTDHYYTGDYNAKHKETDPIYLVNEYARTKYAGEAFALTYNNSLVVRTNIVGFRDHGELTFVEWVIKTLTKSLPITLFDDFFTSSIYVSQLALILFDLIQHNLTGIINIASSEVVSKKEFIERIANHLNISIKNSKIGKVCSTSSIRRGESLGLDVKKIERILGYAMPTTDDAIKNIVEEYRRNKSEIR
jgi:dTDP-4-dehydrorhamnose reductase